MTTQKVRKRNRSGALGRARGRVVVAVALVLVLAMAGTAAAWWGATGAGTGSASTDSGAPVTFTPGTPAAQLHPGGLADVTLVISNPNPFAVRMEALSLDVGQGSGGFAVDVAHTGCVLSTLSFATQSNGGSGWIVPAADGGVDGSLPVTLTDALGMGVDAANACQGATFTVHLKAGV